ncbi:MAG: response regulator transcription factor [Psychrobium sp.]
MNNQVLVINLDGEDSFPFNQSLADCDLTVKQCDSTLECFYLLQRQQYALVILNISKPNFNEFSVLINLRNACNAPIFMFSPTVEQFDLIHALELGANDYFGYQTHPRELVARIKAQLRPLNTYNDNSQSIALNGVELCNIKRQVTYCGQHIALTGVEFELMQFLMTNAGQIISREILGKVLFNRSISSADRSLDVHVSNVRKKLSAINDSCHIQTIRGSGYLFLEQTTNDNNRAQLTT